MDDEVELPDNDPSEFVLILAITPPNGLTFRREVTPGLTIGSAAESSIQIDEAGIDACHATVRTRDDGVPEIYSSKGVFSEAGEPYSSLPLVSGSRFWVGSHGFACAEVAADTFPGKVEASAGSVTEVKTRKSVVLQYCERGGNPRNVTLSDGLIIGRDPEADVVVKGSNVKPHHAILCLRDDGLFELQVPSGLKLRSGCVCTGLLLIPMVDFTIGDCEFTCIWMRREEAAENRIRVRGPVDFALRCAQCKNDIASLPPAAAFCPWCGQRLPNIVEMFESILAEEESKSSETAARAGAAPANGYLEKFTRLMREKFDSEYTAPDGCAHSLMLVGYGNALFNLGWQYESGAGRFRILREALRYYRKAARLGNPVAKARAAAASDEQPVPAQPIDAAASNAATSQTSPSKTPG